MSHADSYETFGLSLSRHSPYAAFLSLSHADSYETFGLSLSRHSPYAYNESDVPL